MKVFQGSPQNTDQLSDNEKLIYGLLDELHIEYKRVEHEAVFTVAESQSVAELLEPAKHCKNLFLCPFNKSQYYLLVMPAEKKFASGSVSRQIHSSRLQFASDEDLAACLQLKSGSVGALALAMDKDKKVQLLVDKAVLTAEYVSSHPGVNTASIALKTTDLFSKYLPATGHDYIVVEC